MLYYQKVLIYQFRLNDVQENFRARLPLSVIEPSLEEIKLLHMNHEMDLHAYPWISLKEKIENKTWKCLCAQTDGKNVGYIFYSTSEMSVTGSKKIEFVLPAYSGYPFKLFVVPEYRSRSIGKHLEYSVHNMLISMNHFTAFRATNSTNEIQIHNYGKMKGSTLGSLNFFKTRVCNAVYISRGLRKSELSVKRII